MDIVKFKITSKTIKVEVRNSNNYVFNFNTALEIEKGDREVLLRLYNALDLLFKKENAGEVKQGESEGWHLLNASLGGNVLQRKVRLNVGVKNILDKRQIRSGASQEVGHDGGDLRPVHWGRTFFVSAVFWAHTKK